MNAVKKYSQVYYCLALNINQFQQTSFNAQAEQEPILKPAQPVLKLPMN